MSTPEMIIAYGVTLFNSDTLANDYERNCLPVIKVA